MPTKQYFQIQQV